MLIERTKESSLGPPKSFAPIVKQKPFLCPVIATASPEAQRMRDSRFTHDAGIKVAHFSET